MIAEYPSLDKPDDEVVASKNCIMLVTNEESNSARTLSQIAYWKQSHAQLRIIVLSNRFDLSVALDAIKVGALGYLLNSDITRDILLRSMELVLLGVVIFSPKLLDTLQTHILGEISSQDHRVSSQSPNTESNTFPMTISHRERLILSHLTRGASNKHIAKELGIAEATVKVHVKHILRKTRVQNRTQAAMWALENDCGGDVEAT